MSTRQFEEIAHKIVSERKIFSIYVNGHELPLVAVYGQPYESENGDAQPPESPVDMVIYHVNRGWVFIPAHDHKYFQFFFAIGEGIGDVAVQNSLAQNSSSKEEGFWVSDWCFLSDGKEHGVFTPSSENFWKDLGEFLENSPEFIARFPSLAPAAN